MNDNQLKVHVELGNRSYNITIAPGVLGHAGAIIGDSLNGRVRRVAVISNNVVHEYYGKRLEKSLRSAGLKFATYLIGDGERWKSLQTAGKVWTFLIENRFERSDCVVALGGGVVGDLAGFVSANYLRGIDYIQIPTTLLAQIDSSVGGKTAVNHKLGKNLIGSFHQPGSVIIDTDVLKTLPAREMHAGLFEAVKYGIIRDRQLNDFINSRLEAIRGFDAEALSRLIARCCEIKAEIVAADERESGLRRILNFGHTVGHALEAVTGYRRLKHGEAVGYGMKCASAIAERAGIILPAEAGAINRSIDVLGRLPRIGDLKSNLVLEAMTRDKKVAHGKLPLILPTRVGEVIIRDDIPPQLIQSAVNDMLKSVL